VTGGGCCAWGRASFGVVVLCLYLESYRSLSADDPTVFVLFSGVRFSSEFFRNSVGSAGVGDL